MSQNAPNPISIYIFFRGLPPDPRHWGSAPDPRGGEGGEGRERGRRGKRRGGGKFASLPLGG